MLRLLLEKFQNMQEGHTIVVEKSTLPVKTAQTIKAILDAAVKEKNHLDEKKNIFSFI